MRIRKKPNLIPRMERCAHVQVFEPEQLKGQWKTISGGRKELHVELGCGKGRFTANTAEANPDVFLVAIEKVPDAMVVAMERVCEMGLENVRFMDRDVVKLPEIFENGEADRVYINFCDPWPKSRDAKYRLTAPDFLRKYADILPLGGQIHFKTDNTPLFTWSLEQFEAEGWQLSEVTNDLHANGPVGIMTDYEAKFYAEGMTINRLVATKVGTTKDTKLGSAGRLRNAFLSDAKGHQEDNKE
jgi:tRNA (guanine-N7-)-methyltransferase